MKTVVVAHYNEDLQWTHKIPEDIFVAIINKGDSLMPCKYNLIWQLPNVGREPHTYFWYIVNHYEYLEGTYFFVQGNPFPHEPDLLDFLQYEVEGFSWLGQHPYTSKPDGKPQDSGLDLHKVSAVWGAEPQDEYGFRASCIVAVDAETIKRHPKSIYEELLELMTKDRNPWAMERLWGTLWG